ALAALAKRLREAGSKAILFGRAFTEHAQAPALLEAIEDLAWATGAITDARSSVMYIGPQNNSQGALDMGLVPDFLPGYVPVTDEAARQPIEQQWGVRLPAARGRTARQILAAAAAGEIRA